MNSASRELNRLRYLAAMGVTPLVSRRALPGAAPTVRLALKNKAEAAVEKHHDGSPPDRSPAAEQGAISGAGPAPRALREMLGSSQPAAQKRDEQPAEAPRTTTAAPGPAERFRLSAIVCAQRLWIEDLGDGALAREQLALVTNMARALVHPAPCKDPVVHQFDWPMHDNAQLQLGVAEAAASLEGFLTRQLDDHACVELLCLGDGARERIRSLALPCATRSLCSTAEMLRNPLRKRDVWHELRLG